MSFLIRNRTNQKILLIVLILAVVGGGILGYMRVINRGINKETISLTKPADVKKLEKVPKDETANWKTYKNDLWGFEIKYPPDFYLEPVFGGAIRISSESNPGFQDIKPYEKVTIDIYRFPNYKNRSVDYLFSHHPDFMRGERILVGNELAVRLIDEDFLGVFTYFVRDDGYIYVIRGASGTEEYFSQYRDLIEKIENTFKFIEKKEVLEPTGVKPSTKPGWWIYKNKKYKYIIEFPDSVTLEDLDNVLGRVSENSRRIRFYLEEHPVIPYLIIEVSPSYDPNTTTFSREEFINKFVTIKAKREVPKMEVIDATDIFNQMLSTLRVLE